MLSPRIVANTQKTGYIDDTDEVFLRELFSSFGYSKSFVDMLIEGDSEVEFLSVMDEVKSLVEALGKQKRLREEMEQLSVASREVAKTIRETSKKILSAGKKKRKKRNGVQKTLKNGKEYAGMTGVAKLGSPQIQLGESPKIQEVPLDYKLIYKSLFPLRADFPKFTRELTRISKTYPELPQDFHAWIVFSGKWEFLVNSIAQHQEKDFGGDEHTIFLAVIPYVPAIISDPSFLLRNPLSVELEKGRTAILANIFDIYSRLGLGGSQVLDSILLGIQKHIPKEETGEPPQRVKARRGSGPSKVKKMEEPNPSTKKGVKTADGDGADEPYVPERWSEVVDPEVLKVVTQVNALLSDGDTSLRLNTDEVLRNAFGRILFSSRVTAEKRKLLRAYFDEEGYYSYSA